jgi:WD40 repeat protein
MNADASAWEPDRTSLPIQIEIPDHDLLCCIGRGSYGQVWLARNILGSYRAIKIVRRQNFDDQRPFDREFHGIQKFEPVSRSNDGLIDILQVGRNEEKNYFFYVMELGDDVVSGQTIDPDHYVPRTLRRDVNRCGCLPASECVRLGLELTDALGALHRSGLVHRDIKPSNIIFIKGLPRLADIGLVTTIDATFTFVGTEGFIPPEGPGTPKADIYSLGKVLYEIITGKDRQEFPDLPTAMRSSEDREALLELNEVLIKACASNVSKRYASAEEMHAELALLRSGKSVRRLRLAELRFARARRAGLVAIGIALFSILVGFGFAYQARVERRGRQRIQEALARAEAADSATRRESYSRAMLLAYESLEGKNFGQVRELLEQTRAFATDANPKTITQLLSLELSSPKLEHRDESTAILTKTESEITALAVSPNGEWLAGGEHAGSIWIWNLSGHDRKALKSARARVESLVFSPDNRLLATGDVDGSVRIFRVPSGELLAEYRQESRILDLRFTGEAHDLFDCSTHGAGRHSFLDGTDSPHTGNLRALRASLDPNARLLATVQPEGLIWFWLGTSNLNVFPDVVGNEFHDHGQAFSPNSQWLAVSVGDYSIELWSVTDKKPIRRLIAHTDAVVTTAWSPDNELLASSGNDQTVAVWRRETGELLGRLHGHQQNVTCLAFSIDGRTLYSGSEDRTIRVWTPSSLQAKGFAFSQPMADKALPHLTTTNSVANPLPWEWRHLQYESRDEATSVFAQSTSAVSSLAVSFNGKWIAGGMGGGQVLLWTDLKLQHEWQLGHRDVECLDFSPSGERLAAGCRDGSVIVLSIPSGNVITNFIQSGSQIAVRFANNGNGLGFVSSRAFASYNFLEQTRRDGGPFFAWRAAISPDLKFIALGQPEGLVIYSGATNVIFPNVRGNQFHESQAMAISPNGQWLATALADRSIEIWLLPDKRPVQRLIGHSSTISALAWSADSRLLASGGYDQIIIIWDAQREKILRRLRGHEDYITTLSFSPDGDTLYSGSYDRTFRVWTGFHSPSAPEVVALDPHVTYSFLSPGARVACGGTADYTLWTIETNPSPMFHAGDSKQLGIWAVSPDGGRLICYRHPDDTLDLYRRTTNRFVRYSKRHGISHGQGVPAFSPDGRRVAMTTTNNVVAVWEFEPWNQLARWEGLEGRVDQIVFDPPGKRAFVRCPSFGVLLGEVETRRLFRMPNNRKPEVSSIAISPDNSLLAMGNWDGAVFLWFCPPGDEPRNAGIFVKERSDVWSVAFSPDGRRLATGLANGDIHLWDIQNKILVAVLKGHTQPVHELGFNPDDDSLVSIAHDELRVWRVAAEREAKTLHTVD